MDLNSNTLNSTTPDAPAAVGANQFERLARETERVQSGAVQRIRPVVDSVSELSESYDGDEAILQTSAGTKLLRSLNGVWTTQTNPDESLEGLKIETGSDGIPALRTTIGGKRYRLPFVEDR
ncbi:MAG: hypothetical protein A2Y38_22990 [Spirochaetes bacterium GWB1_59_5]|nr:MAG: hypothetical protein A2Y38_22990 [Spirochaetes bacterium GWB1_59_5]